MSFKPGSGPGPISDPQFEEFMKFCDRKNWTPSQAFRWFIRHCEKIDMSSFKDSLQSIEKPVK